MGSVKSDKLDEILKQISGLSNRLYVIEQQLEIVNELKIENKCLQKRVDDLEYRFDISDQQKISDCLVIHGTPIDKSCINVNNNAITGVCNEAFLSLKKVTGQLGVICDVNNIVECYRLSSKNSSSGIFVKFNNVEMKSRILEKRREIKNQLTCRKLGYNEDTPIYINEALTPYKRRLLATAKKLNKTKMYKFIWIKDTNIMMRKQEGQKKIYIKKFTDLEKI